MVRESAKDANMRLIVHSEVVDEDAKSAKWLRKGVRRGCRSAKWLRVSSLSEVYSCNREING